MAWHHRRVLTFTFLTGQKSRRWRERDENLKTFAHMAATLANFHGRTNLAFGVTAQGLAAACGLPALAQPSGAGSSTGLPSAT